MFVYIFFDSFLHGLAASDFVLEVRPDITFGLESKKLLPGELQAVNRRVILTHAHEAFRVGTGTGEVVPHGFHQGYLAGLRQLELVDDALVDDLLGRQYEQHVRVADDVFRVLVIGQLVRGLDNGIYGSVLFPYLLVAEGHGTVYAAACGRIHHLCGFGILVENQYAALSPVTEQLFMDNSEYHAHDQV